MSRRIFIALLPLLALCQPAIADLGVPQGWGAGGTAAMKDFELGTAPVAGDGRKQAAYIKSRQGSTPSGFFGLNQCIAATDYRGKRLRLSASLRSVNASSEQLWMRVDGASPGEGRPARVLGFYNNVDQGITGTTDWKRYDVVLDVPEQSAQICYGFLLNGGKGEAWADDLSLTAVGKDVPVSQTALPKAPVNLGFDR